MSHIIEQTNAEKQDSEGLETLRAVSKKTFD